MTLLLWQTSKCTAVYSIIRVNGFKFFAKLHWGPLTYSYLCETFGHKSWSDNIYVNNKNALFKALEVFDETNNFNDHLAMCVSLLCTEYYKSIDNIKTYLYSYAWSKEAMRTFNAFTDIELQFVLEVFLSDYCLM